MGLHAPSAEQAEHDTRQPRRVFLFSGHMIDAPNRPRARFPPEMEQAAGDAIAARLDDLGMNERDLAICGGACGGDLLFAEAALQRACRLRLYLQYDEAEFLRASVAFAGQSWVERYKAVKAHPLASTHIQPDELGPLPSGTDPYVRNNQWQLSTALAYGADRLTCLFLWDGERSTSPGGTQDMVDAARLHFARITIIDTRLLPGCPARAPATDIARPSGVTLCS